MADLFAAKEDTARRLAELLDAGRGQAPAAASNGWGYPAAVVLCGDADEGNPGYHTATLVWHGGDDWTPGSESEVRLRHLAGSRLRPGRPYTAVGAGRVDEGIPVYWTADPSPRKSPIEIPCLVPDGYGGVAGLAQRWEYSDGTVKCETRGFCDGDDCGSGSVPPPPVPPVTLNIVYVSLLLAGGAPAIRDVTVNGTTQATDGSGHTTFLVPDGSYTAVCQTFVGETISWALTGATGGPDSGSGATTDSFAVAGGGEVDVTFAITAAPGPP